MKKQIYVFISIMLTYLKNMIKQNFKIKCLHMPFRKLVDKLLKKV